MKKLIIGALSAFLTVSGIGCTSVYVPYDKGTEISEKVRNSPLIVGFEGTQPFSGHSIDSLTGRIASELNFAQSATSGNEREHLNYAQKAHENGHDVYIVGYSAGAMSARSLAEKCNQKGIPVKCLFLLDPTYTAYMNGKIPGNVEKVVCYRSSSPTFVTGKEISRGDAERSEIKNERILGADHMDLPSCVYDRIKTEIGQSGKGTRIVSVPQPERKPVEVSNKTYEVARRTEVKASINPEVYETKKPVEITPVRRTEDIEEMVRSEENIRRQEKEKAEQHMRDIEKQKEMLRGKINRKLEQLDRFGGGSGLKELQELQKELSDLNSGR